LELNKEEQTTIHVSKMVKFCDIKPRADISPL
jgi:hypothetical protein